MSVHSSCGPDRDPPIGSLQMHPTEYHPPEAEDVEHVGDVQVRRRWVQFARRPVSMIWSIQMPAGNEPRYTVKNVIDIERVRREESVGARLLNGADVYLRRHKV